MEHTSARPRRGSARIVVGLASACALGSMIGLTGCAADQNDVPTVAVPETALAAGVAITNPPTVTRTGVTVNVIAIDNTFRPAQTTVKVGDTVTFTNKGKNDHDVLPQQGSDWGVQIGGFKPGATYSYAFTKPGVYAYYCSIHGTNRKGMVGTITVEP